MNLPDLGAVVRVWPVGPAPVRSHDPAIVNRYLPADGADLPWSPWLLEMHGQGHVTLTDPRPRAPVAKPE